MNIKRRLTEHTHCGSEPNWKFSLPGTETGLVPQASVVPS